MKKYQPGSSSITKFRAAVLEFLTPLASDFHFELKEVSPRLFALTSASLSVKVYLPECHGFDVTITLVPTFSDEWYAPEERSLYWFGLFLGLGEFRTSRGTLPEQLTELVQTQAGFLRQVLAQVLPSRDGMWEELNAYIHTQISEAKAYEHEQARARQQSEVRQRAETAWRAKDYTKVVLLYESILDELTVAEVKKLEYAQKHNS